MTALMGIDVRLRLAKLHLITTIRGGGDDLRRFIDAVCSGGVDIVTIRDEEASPKQLTQALDVAREAAFAHKALVFVGGDAAVAGKVGADGVQVDGAEDVREAHRQTHRWAVVGRSVYDNDQLAEAVADEGVQYLTVGPVFATSQHARYQVPGLDLVRAAASAAPPLTPGATPWFAVGGMTLDTLDEVLAAGARRVGVVSAITRADDPRGAAEKLADRVRAAWEADPLNEAFVMGSLGGGGLSFKAPRG